MIRSAAMFDFSGHRKRRGWVGRVSPSQRGKRISKRKERHQSEIILTDKYVLYTSERKKGLDIFFSSVVVSIEKQQSSNRRDFANSSCE
jgi:IS1 family transposase